MSQILVKIAEMNHIKARRSSKSKITRSPFAAQSFVCSLYLSRGRHRQARSQHLGFNQRVFVPKR